MRRVARDPVARMRFRMVEVAQREGVTAAARRYGVSRPTVYKVLHRWEAEGATGLLNRPRGGQGAIAEEIIEVDTPGLTSPRLAGFGFKNLKRPIFPLDAEMLGITELKAMTEE